MSEGLNIIRSDKVYRNMRNPYLLKDYYRFKTIELMKEREVYGSSPPDLFVGRIGYPNVYIGPLVPPQVGNTEILGTPEKWVGKSIPEIVELRSLLIRGMHRTKVTSVGSGRIEDVLAEIALAERHTDVEMKLSRMPNLSMNLSENTQPFGPSAPIERIELGNSNAEKNIEKAYSDSSMPASEAIGELYVKGVLVSKIQKALSAGLLGRGKKRRFVPTRWSITAVDDTLSKQKLMSIKEYNPIAGIRVYENIALDNRWVIIMFPGSWEYESIEAWYPNTTWNLNGTEIDMGSSYESYNGRKTYAEIGGCYYAARLAVSELLDSCKSQAKVVILREVHQGYIMPVGVWNVREHVRETLRKAPKAFESVEGVLKHASALLDIPVVEWVKNSMLLRNILRQRRLAI